MTVNCVRKNGDILKYVNVMFPVECNLVDNTITLSCVNGECYTVDLTVIDYFEVYNETPGYIQSLKDRGRRK